MLFAELAGRVREAVGAFRALALVSLDGSIEESIVDDRGLDPECLTEFATLLRIAERTSEDAGTGGLEELTWVADRSVVLSRRVSTQHYLILVLEPDVRSAQARYVLRRAAGQFRPEIENA